jgi:ubiquinone/menaquinone biosynthesis C-methylase UbiE
MNKFDPRTAWNQVAAVYQARNPISAVDVHYGPWSPPERDLQLFGPVPGRRVLEIGCGGGQSCVALARQGAHVTGLDISREQLVFARRLAAQAQVTVEFIEGQVESLTDVADATFDLIFSAYTFHYMADLPTCLAACYRLLSPTGRLVFSLDHPLRACFFDEQEHELSLYPVRSYFDDTALRWRFPETGVMMQSYHYTITQWIDLLSAAGYYLVRLVEPPMPVDLADALWPTEDLLFPMRNLPQTMIFCVGKRWQSV